MSKKHLLWIIPPILSWILFRLDRYAIYVGDKMILGNVSDMSIMYRDPPFRV